MTLQQLARAEEGVAIFVIESLAMTDVAHAADLGPLIARLEDPAVGANYRIAEPFPHVVVDHAVDERLFRGAVDEFPRVHDPRWKHYLQVNQTKFAHTDVDEWGPSLQALSAALTGPRFVRTLEQLTGFKGLLADPSMDGGGLHQTLRGGHLNVHRDFTTHHREPSWQRRVNILLYLHDRWSPAWGGELELWDQDVSGPIHKIAPLGNRMLIFTTSGAAYHGHPRPLRCPEGIARRSLALYYFTVEQDPLARATDYRARPGDGLRAVPIWLDARLLRVYDSMKRRFGLSDRFAHILSAGVDRLGSRLRRTSGPDARP